MCWWYLETFAFCDQGYSRHPGSTQMLCFNIFMALETQSDDICVSMQAVPSADGGEQELSRLTHSVWELS